MVIAISSLASASGQDGIPGNSLARDGFRSNSNLRISDLEETELEEPESPFENHIETDRDSITPSTRTTDPGFWIIESSYTFVDNRTTPEKHSFPELLFRYGLSDRIELRFGANYEVGGEGAAVSGASASSDESASESSAETTILYGLKAGVTDQYDLLPGSSLIFQGRSPVSGPESTSSFSTGYVFGWELPGEWALDSSVRLTFDEAEDDRFHSWLPSIVLRKTVGERLNLHAEYFGSFSQGKVSNFNQQFFSPRVHYLLSPNTEIGVRVGWGLNDASAPFFSNIGLGWRY